MSQSWMGEGYLSQCQTLTTCFQRHEVIGLVANITAKSQMSNELLWSLLRSINVSPGRGMPRDEMEQIVLKLVRNRLLLSFS